MVSRCLKQHQQQAQGWDLARGRSCSSALEFTFSFLRGIILAASSLARLIVSVRQERVESDLLSGKLRASRQIEHVTARSEIHAQVCSLAPADASSVSAAVKIKLCFVLSLTRFKSRYRPIG